MSVKELSIVIAAVRAMPLVVMKLALDTEPLTVDFSVIMMIKKKKKCIEGIYQRQNEKKK